MASIHPGGKGVEWARGMKRWRGRAVASIVALVAAGALAQAPAGSASAQTSAERVIVQAASSLAASQAVAAFGGSVEGSIPAGGEVVADMAQSAASALAQQPGVLVSPDLPVEPESTSYSTSTPSAVFPEVTHADQLWAAGINGAGVTVAVLDTGIDPLPDFSGRLVGGVDLTGEGNPFQDDYGHGTFVAGLIAGNGASSGGQYTGEAPGANLVSIKVAGASGITDEATVIEGIQWAIANKASLGIDVLNISLGTEATSPTQVSPLDQAVEAAWHAGIVVVTSAGNNGPGAETITSPGDDPLVITAGALNDDAGTNPANYSIPSFSGVGPTAYNGWLKPDLVADGRSVISLRAPGSTIDTGYPSARIGTSNFVGSGTSFSAAITSGAAALVLQAHPGLSPDAVKGSLLAKVSPGPVANPLVDGQGLLNAYGAVTAGGSPSVAETGASGVTVGSSGLLTGYPTSSGGTASSLGSAWASSPWNPANWNSEAWNSEAWNSEAWNSEAWNSEAWNSEAWNSEAWNSEAWNSEAWNSEAWNSEAWNSEAWN